MVVHIPLIDQSFGPMKNRVIRLFLSLMFLCALSACETEVAEGLHPSAQSDFGESATFAGAPARPALAAEALQSRGRVMANHDATPGSAQDYLAYEHSVELHVAEADVAKVHDRIVERCGKDREHACSVLRSDLRSGAHAHASLRLRLRKQGIAPYVNVLKGSGDLIAQSVHVDDLAKPVVDTERRLRMLTEQRDQLTEMKAQVGKDFDALIRITREISNLQNQIERLTGSRAHLLERINLDILNVQVSSQGRRSFWTPVSEALSRFWSNLSVGIANVVSTMAFLLPWIVVAVPGLFLAKLLLGWMRSS